MMIFAIDDEELLLDTLTRKIQEAAPQAEVLSFGRVSEVIRAVTEGKKRPEVVFLDIEMPGMRGLELAKHIKEASPNTHIIFVTGYSEYAVDAYRIHARGYILKPVSTDRIQEELAALSAPSSPPSSDQSQLRVQCFGSFEVFWNNVPLHFARQRTKELLAFLIDQRGTICSAGEIITALWEDGLDMARKRTYLRALTADLRRTLKSIGMEHLLIREYNQWAIRTRYVNCDYYRFLRGDMEAINSYRGEYMIQYSWAEMTAAQLAFELSLNE